MLLRTDTDGAYWTRGYISRPPSIMYGQLSRLRLSLGMLTEAFVGLLRSLLPLKAQRWFSNSLPSSALPPAMYHYTRVFGGLDGRLLSPTLGPGSDGTLLVPFSHEMKMLAHRTLILLQPYARISESRQVSPRHPY